VIELRQYQIDSIEALRKSLRTGHKKPILVSPTASGKSITFGEIISGSLEKDNKILWVVHRRNLVQEMYRKLKDKFGIDAGIIMAGYEHHLDRQVQLCSIQTYGRRLNLEEIAINKFFVDADLVLVDEVHRSVSKSYQDVINLYSDKVIIGCTATPVRGDGRGLGEIFDDIVMGPSVKELTKQGYLSPVRYFVPSKVDLSDVPIQMGDYQIDALGNKMTDKRLIGDIVENWLRVGENRKTLVYAVNVKHSIALQEEFIRAGVKTARLDARSSDEERDEVFRAIDSGDITVLINILLFCLDDKTDILTSSGWMSINELTYDHKIANWSNDGTVFFDNPEAIVKRDLFDDEYFITTKSRSSNIRITNTHKVVYLSSSGWKKKKAQDLVGKMFKYPVSGNAEPLVGYEREYLKVPKNKNKAITSNSWTLRKAHGFTMEESKRIASEIYDHRANLKTKLPHELSLHECLFIGLWLGDGSINNLRTGGTEYTLFQSLRYPKTIKVIDTLLKKLGLHNIRREKESWLNGKRFFNLIAWSFPRGTGGYNQSRKGVFEIEPYLKKGGTDLLWGLNSKQFKSLLFGLWLADGNHTHTKYREITSTNKKFIDLIQAIGVCRGISIVMSEVFKGNEKHSQRWMITYSNRKHRNIAGRFRLHKDENQDGSVWCVKSGSGNIITRRDGRVAVTGNTEGLDVPSISSVVFARPTKSLGLYLQAGGRGLRIEEGKENLIFLDHANVVSEFGLLDWDREWTLDGKKKAYSKPKREVVKRLVHCRACGLTFEGSSICPDCGTAVVSFGKDIETIEDELEELKAKEKKVDGPVEKRIFCGMLKYWLPLQKNPNPKRVYGIFKGKYGHYPHASYSDVAPIEPSPEFLNYMKYQQIKYAKRRNK